MIDFLIGFAAVAGIYAVFALGLNIHWGYTGLFNIGVAGFFALGAYTTAILSSRPPLASQFEDYAFGGDLPARFDSIPVLGALDLWFLVTLVAAAAAAGVVALAVGAVTLRLRDDYLAISTLGVAESIRLVFLNEKWLGNGSKGMYTIPRVFDDLVSPQDYDRVYLLVVVAVMVVLFAGSRVILDSPWGRVLRAIREDETTAAASGKNVLRFKLQAFVLGAMVMGVGGALYAYNLRAISPFTFTPLLGTFLIWAMLMVGGSGKFWGPVVGAFVVWGIWSGSQFLPGPAGSANVRFFAIGALIVAVLVLAPQGLAEEARRLARALRRRHPEPVADP